MSAIAVSQLTRSKLAVRRLAQRVQHAVGVVLHVGHRDPLGARVAGRQRVIGVGPELGDAAVLDRRDHPAVGLADAAEGDRLHAHRLKGGTCPMCAIRTARMNLLAVLWPRQWRRRARLSVAAAVRAGSVAADSLTPHAARPEGASVGGHLPAALPRRSGARSSRAALSQDIGPARCARHACRSERPPRASVPAPSAPLRSATAATSAEAPLSAYRTARFTEPLAAYSATTAGTSTRSSPSVRGRPLRRAARPGESSTGLRVRR